MHTKRIDTLVKEYCATHPDYVQYTITDVERDSGINRSSLLRAIARLGLQYPCYGRSKTRKLELAIKNPEVLKKTRDELAAEFDLSPDSVTHILKRNGAKAARKKRFCLRDQKHRKKITRLLQKPEYKSLTMRELRVKLQAGEKTIKSVLRELDKRENLLEALQRPENRDLSVRELCKKFHVSDRTIKKTLDQANIGRVSNACKGKIMREAFKSDPDAWQGKTLQELADFFKCNPATVRLACRECGIFYKYGNGHHAETSDFWNDVRDHPDWFEKLDLKAICLRYEVSESTVRKAIDGGLKVQPTTHKHSQLRDEMRDDPAKFDGMTPAAIAEKYGCAVGTAIKNGRFFGVKLRFERKKKVAPKSCKRKLLEGRKKELVNLCKIMTLAELARHFNCVERTIRNYCDELGVKPVRKRRAPTPFVSEKEQEKREFFSELERDDEYFDVINRNRGLGISLTGDYWKRYRELLAMKLRDGEGIVFHEGAGKGAARNRPPRRIDGGYIF